MINDRFDTDGRELTDKRRYAPTSIPLRRNPCSRSPEPLFEIPRRAQKRRWKTFVSADSVLTQC